MSRVRLTINRDWRFFRGDVEGAERMDFDDSSWQPIGLPHCFDLPYFRTPDFYVGVGWYRKRIDTTALSIGKYHVGSLEFDGAFQVADVFLNGKRVGEHRGGYTGFSIECAFTPGANLLAVRASNEWNPQLAPRAGEHIFSGGLYRDVHLVLPDAVHVAWNGIRLMTSQVSHHSAMLRVATEVRNASMSRNRCTVRQSILDPDGSVAAAFESTKSIPAQSSFTFDQSSELILNPKLWHPDHPYLYRLKTELFRDEESSSTMETPFGFRWFEWTKDRGFFLNGEHLYLRRANAHQDHAGWGIGVTRAAVERDVKLIREAGFNFVRGAHYPHHPAFADACDKHGLLFMPENCFWGKGGFGPEGYWNASAYPVNAEDFEPFEEHCKETLREMIRINRNHPSIVAWSMCNEPFFTYNLGRAKNLLRDLVNLSRELDPTRPAAIGGAQRGEIDKLGDIAAYNGDGARLFIDPGVPNMVSEYGAIHKPPDAFEPFFGELQPERFPWRSGEAIWCAFDYGTIAGKQGLKGIVDHARLPKRSWHWYRQENLGLEPPPAPREGIASRLRLRADKPTIQGIDATDDCQLIVTVCDADGNHISNSPPVTLTIEFGPGEFPTGRSITFDEATNIKITLGQAAIAFRSYHGGETLIRATSPALDDATLTITTIGSLTWESAGSPLAVSRPYVVPKPSEAATNAMKNHVNVALNRPSRASGEGDDHPARCANDGMTDSLWRAAPTDSDPWWQVDLEGFYQISGSRITFPSSGAKYRIDTSLDNKTWTPAVDKTRGESRSALRNDIYPPGTVARYLRVSFVNASRAELREVEVFGVISLR